MTRTRLTLPVALTAAMLGASVLAAGGSAGCSGASGGGGRAGVDASHAAAGRDGGAGQGGGGGPAGVGAAGTVGADACVAAADGAAASDDANAGRDTSDSDAGAACAACELASSDVSCESDFLTSTRDAQGNPIGWGTGTSQTDAARETGEALLHCIIVNHCSANPTNDGPGNNAVLGCFCGSGVKLDACLSGAGIHGACVAEYEAAAVATPTGPAACSPIAAFADFVARVATNVKSPIGLADNVASCAFTTPCPVCNTL